MPRRSPAVAPAFDSVRVRSPGAGLRTHSSRLAVTFPGMKRKRCETAASRRVHRTRKLKFAQDDPEWYFGLSRRFQELPLDVVQFICDYLPTRVGMLVNKEWNRAREARAKLHVPLLMQRVCEDAVDENLWNTSYASLTIVTPFNRNAFPRDVVFQKCDLATQRRLLHDFPRDKRLSDSTRRHNIFGDEKPEYNMWLSVLRAKRQGMQFRICVGRVGVRRSDGRIKWLKNMSLLPGWSWASLEEFLKAWPQWAPQITKTKWRYKQYRNAVRNNDVRTLHLLRQWGPIDYLTLQKHPGWSDIMYTVIRNGYTDVLPYVSVDGYIDGASYLYVACAEGQLDIVKRLLRREKYGWAHCKHCVQEGQTPFYAAMVGGHVDILQLLQPIPEHREMLCKIAQSWSNYYMQKHVSELTLQVH